VFDFLFKRSTASQKSVLRHQKLKRRKSVVSASGPKGGQTSIRGRVFLFSLAIFSSIVAFALMSNIGGKLQLLWNDTTNLAMLTPRSWNVQVRDLSSIPLSDESRREIHRIASKHLKSGHPDELLKIAQATEASGHLEQTKVLRLLSDTIVVTTQSRVPVLIVEVGSKKRYLTAEGTIYGEVSSLPADSDEGREVSVLLTGVFDNRSEPPIGFDDNGRLRTTNDEKKILIDALNVLRISKNASFKITKINYQTFRGFLVTLEDSTEIVLGFSPFDYKINKLTGILSKIKSQGIIAARIEIDYEGKAFIKERKL
jgi:hypothetical protein